MADKLVGYKDSAGEVVLMPQKYGTKGDKGEHLLGKLSLQAHLQANDLVPQVAPAVKFAENNKRNHGVLSVKTDNPSQVLNNSVYNNFVRWDSAGRPGKFVDFMQRRWAPIGASNDPKNLNKNWAGNVRDSLRKNPNVDYEELQANNIALNQSPLGAFTA